MFMGYASDNKVLGSAETAVGKAFRSTTGLSQNPNQVLLRWSGRTSLRRGVVVQVIETHASVAVIRCDLRLSEKTKVYLMGDKITRTGIVQACRPDGAQFLLTIRATKGDFRLTTASVFDPGIRAVEDFLSEEQERQILEAL